MFLIHHQLARHARTAELPSRFCCFPVTFIHLINLARNNCKSARWPWLTCSPCETSVDTCPTESAPPFEFSLAKLGKHHKHTTSVFHQSNVSREKLPDHEVYYSRINVRLLRTLEIEISQESGLFVKQLVAHTPRPSAAPILRAEIND